MEILLSLEAQRHLSTNYHKDASLQLELHNVVKTCCRHCLICGILRILGDLIYNCEYLSTGDIAYVFHVRVSDGESHRMAVIP
jgi:hypothetical protein